MGKVIKRFGIVLIGAVQSTAALLDVLAVSGADIKALLTLSPEIGKRRHADYVDLSKSAARHGVNCHVIDDVDERAVALLNRISPDVLFIFGWSRLIGPAALSASRFGAVGFHPAPLPVGRGRHPLIWTILNGLEKSAVCFFRIGSRPDDGEILVRRDFDVASNETATTLMAKVTMHACEALPDLLAHIGNYGLSGKPQDDRAAVVWRKRASTDGKIDFRMSRDMIDRLVRALTQPYPGADAQHASAGTRKVYRVELRDRPREARYAEPGRVIGSERGMPVVACAGGAVLLCEHDFGGSIQPGSWFL